MSGAGEPGGAPTPGGAPIRVVIADDHLMVREGLRALLQLSPDIVVVGEAADGHQALAAVAAARPDVLLCDVKMPRCDGLTVLRTLAARPSAVPVLVLTTFDDLNLSLDCLRAGARGYLLKDVSRELLVDTVRRLAAGEKVIQTGILEKAPLSALTLGAEPLSPRERSILRLMARGFRNREIAYALDLTNGTVKNYVSSILDKLAVRTRTAAVLKAFDLHI